MWTGGELRRAHHAAVVVVVVVLVVVVVVLAAVARHLGVGRRAEAQPWVAAVGSMLSIVRYLIR